MTVEDIRDQIHRSITRITGIGSADIQDTASYRGDLGLDSLSMLELSVDMEYAFRIKVPDERLEQIATVGDSIQLVQEFLAAQQA